MISLPPHNAFRLWCLSSSDLPDHNKNGDQVDTCRNIISLSSLWRENSQIWRKNHIRMWRKTIRHFQNAGTYMCSGSFELRNRAVHDDVRNFDPAGHTDLTGQLYWSSPRWRQKLWSCRTHRLNWTTLLEQSTMTSETLILLTWQLY